MKKRFVVSILLSIALSIPTIAYGIDNQTTNNNVDNKNQVDLNHSYHHKVKASGRENKFEALLKVEGLSSENKKSLEVALQKKIELKQQFFSLAGDKVQDQKGFDEFKNQAKAIKDKVMSKQITEEEGKKQLDELKSNRKESSKIWKDLSDDGKKKMEELEKESKTLRENNKKYFEEYKKAAESKDTASINNSAKNVIDAINKQNSLMQRKIDILKKEAK
ncbi:hypothetical protein [Clostridium folliculivorans]|uniref:Uncharacterized protein n=1 Tax=Clostridium folliculivorans TaxID=2886038 RepID=A0A9W5Y301_9CLOT|nr:hypothetical protein [Clostridium folliculivorans]GKU25794.1 hypothetical protein CFOLD11_26200 [Clostridium folliculivorans]GKU28815.1 hypothetical protein CFB3_09210 [Clostridium folliculivorans]